MNKKLVTGLLFGVGVAAAVAITYKIVKNKQEILAQEQINEIKEAYKEQAEPLPVEEAQQKAKATTNKPDVEKAYKDYTKAYTKEEVIEEDLAFEDDEPEEIELQPIVPETDVEIECITFDDYIEENGFSKLAYILYADGTLADDGDQIIFDVDSKLGVDNLIDFRDSVLNEYYIRNNELLADYEILKDLRSYEDVTGSEGSPIY